MKTSKLKCTILLFPSGEDYGDSHFPFESESDRLIRLHMQYRKISFVSSFYRNFQYQDGFLGDVLKIEVREKTASGPDFVNALESYLSSAGTPRSVLMTNDWDAIARWIGPCMEILKDGRIVNRGLC